MAREDDLVAAAALGSRVAVGALFDEYWLTAWRAAYAVTGRSDLADDAAQDAFVSAIRALGRFERGRPFAPWIAKISVNRARDLLRAERRRSATPLDANAEAPAHVDVAGVLGAVALLSREQREVVVLHHVVGFSLKEVAAIVGAPEGTVASRLGRGLARVRERMEAEHA